MIRRLAAFVICVLLLSTMCIAPACAKKIFRIDPEPLWSPGDTVWFGFYEQDGNRSNGPEPVEWVVLDTDPSEATALLLSARALDMRVFHSTYSASTRVSWAQSDLRAWLNGSFYDRCFSEAEREAIVTSWNITRFARQMIETYDKVFLLSFEEAQAYLSSTRVKATDYVSGLKNVALENGYAWWWLRDTTNHRNCANRFKPNGEDDLWGGNVNAQGVCVRPVINVSIPLASGLGGC